MKIGKTQTAAAAAAGARASSFGEEEGEEQANVPEFKSTRSDPELHSYSQPHILAVYSIHIIASNTQLYTHREY